MSEHETILTIERLIAIVKRCKKHASTWNGGSNTVIGYDEFLSELEKAANNDGETK